MLSLVSVALIAVGILGTSYFERPHVLASGISFPGPGFSIPEPLGLIFLGAGIIVLARLGRKKFMRP